MSWPKQNPNPAPAPESARVAVSEVTVTKLRRDTAAVIDRVANGEVGVVSKHGRAVAVLVPVSDRETLRPLAVEDADLAALAGQFAERRRARRWSELLHGRWLNGHGLRGEYPSKRRLRLQREKRRRERGR